MQMTDKEKIREAIMRLSMCANRECEICKYKDRPKNELPSETCKERSIKNVSILADEFLRKVNVSDIDELHKFIEKTLGRPVFIHELAQDNILDEIRLKLKDSFIEIIKNTDKTEEAEQALKESE